ncbi:MAG: Ger(x)C family spore germination protein [Sporomusaceae bacterium]|nr:Ger(x)C family spore germination protein [Sporomusaceae bacterium]
MRRPVILVAGLIVLSILLAGCNGSRELDEIANVIAIGLDTAEQEGMMRVTYQFAVPQAEGGTGEVGKATVLTTNTVSTIAEALNIINSQTALMPSMSHTKVIILGEEMAHKRLDSLLAPFLRYREYRGSMFVVVARGTAKEVLEKNKPVFTTSVSKYYEEMMATGDYAGYFLRTSIHQYYVRTKSHSGQPYMALVAINPDTGEGEISNKKVPGGKTSGYKAGDIPRQGGNVMEFAGTAIFSGDKMVGELSTTETRMLAMLLGEYNNGFLSVEDPLDSKFFVNINLRLGSKPKIRVALVEDRPVIHVSILLEGDISNIGSGINYEEKEYLTLLEAQISRVIQEEMLNLIIRTQGLDSDVAGFGYYLRPAFNTNQEFEQYGWNGKYRQADVFVDIKTQIRRSGLMLRTVATQ